MINYNNIDTVEKQNILEKIVELVKKDNLPNPQNLRRIDRLRLKEKIKLVDEVIDCLQTSNVTEGKKLVKFGALVITQLLGIKEIKNKKKDKLFWRLRIGSNINALRKDVSLIEKWETGMLRKESQKTRLDHLYGVKRKGYKRAAEELKQRIKAKAATLRRYKNRVNQYRQNRLFQSNQSKFYQELDGKSHEENIIPDKKKPREFWSGIWEKNFNHNESADWIHKVAEEMHGNKQQNIDITPTKSKKEFVKWRTGTSLDLMLSMAIGSRCLCQCKKE